MKLVRFYMIVGFVICAYVGYANYVGLIPFGGTPVDQWGPEGKKHGSGSGGTLRTGRSWGGGYHK